MLDVASRDACNRLKGRFVALAAPDSGGPTGSEAGVVPVSGRWLIRECEESIEGNSLHLRFGGPGWQWVDRSAKGFHVKQFVYFSSTVELRGQLDMAYDPSSRIASIWLAPVGDVAAHVDVLGPVNAEAETLGAVFLGALGSAIGQAPDKVARARAADEGAKQFREQLASGVTITYDTANKQLDMLLGQLPNGVAPKRPFAPGPDPWTLNERQALYPGGVEIAGPFEPTASMTLDAFVQGAGVVYRTACAVDAEAAVTSLLAGSATSPVALVGVTPIPSGPRYSLSLVPPSCRWVLVTAATSGTPGVADLELRPQGAIVFAPTSVAWLRVTLVSFTFVTHKPDGQSWDPFGGAPDPEFWIAIDGGRRVFVQKLQNAFAGNLSLASPIVEVSATAPLIIGATDVDVVEGEPMGIATIQIGQLLSAPAGGFDAELQLDGVRTGTAHLVVERSPGR